jgi:DNA-binding NarL/FixJ family response regulator
MGTILGKAPQWWDRDVDQTGTQIREDVREAACKIWTEACRRCRSIMHDDSEAAEIMEASVTYISTYLNRNTTPGAVRNVDSLLLLNFTQEARRRVRKLARHTSLDEQMDPPEQAASSWAEKTNRRIDLDRVASHLTPRSCAILAMRRMGYDWKEIGDALAASPSEARKKFWQDVRRAQHQVLGRNSGNGRSPHGRSNL